MAEHPNVARIRDGYAAFAKGDLTALDDYFDKDLVWHEPGRNQLSGDKHGRDAVYASFGRLAELTHGSFQMELETIFADDDRAVALASTSATVGGRSVTSYGAHIFRLRDGMVMEFWGAPTDPYAFDELLG